MPRARVLQQRKGDCKGVGQHPGLSFCMQSVCLLGEWSNTEASHHHTVPRNHHSEEAPSSQRKIRAPHVYYLRKIPQRESPAHTLI